MKKIKYIVVFIILLLNSTLGAAELKMGGTEWAPYIGKKLKNHGIAAEIVTQIFNRAGHSVQFMFYPWKRTLILAKAGELDGLAIAWFTKERTKTMVYSIPYINTAIVLIKRKNDPFEYNKIEDLYGKNIGVLIGYGYLKKIESDKIKKTFVKSLCQNLLKLANGRIDLTMEERLNVQKTIVIMPKTVQNALTIVKNPFEVKKLHITLSKKLPNHKKLIDDFNKTLSSMIKDGSYKKMIDKLTRTNLEILPHN